MCFIALLYRVVPEYPVVLATNRDESTDRPGKPPREVQSGVWAGLDPQCGGTWLGINAQGRIATVANRNSETDRLPDTRSRGLLCLDMLLQNKSCDLQSLLAGDVKKRRYNAFNLLVADSSRAWTATYAEGRLQPTDLKPGIHVMANTLPNSRDEPKVARGMNLLSEPTDVESAWQLLQSVCGDHGVQPDGKDAICVHATQHKTLSSTFMAIHETDFGLSQYRYAEGNPCTSQYQNYSHLFSK